MSVHHVSLEVQPGDAERVIELFELLGFSLISEPEIFGGNVRWLESGHTQIHLILSEAALVPSLGHAAVVTPDFDETHAALGEAGFEVEDHQELWGARRSFVLGPGGLRVEFMQFPPEPTT